MAQPPPAPTPASPRRPSGPPAPFAARRRQAVLWAVTVVASLTLLLGGFAALTPRPPPGQPFVWRPAGGVGLSPGEAAAVLANAAAMGAAILAVQELLLRPLFGRGAPHATDAVFFGSSIAVRAVFAAALLRHHYGPDGHDAAARGDLAHRLPLVSLFIAAYSTDLVQMLARASEFSNNYTSMVVPHHVLSLAWFGVWLAAAAPRSSAGAPAWNTVRARRAAGGAALARFLRRASRASPSFAGHLLGGVGRARVAAAAPLVPLFPRPLPLPVPLPTAPLLCMQKRSLTTPPRPSST
jgi:hypothetical protein